MQTVVPISFSLLVLQLSVRPLQFFCQDLQVLRQFVLGLEMLREQHEISRGVVQRDVAEEETSPTQVVQVHDAGRTQEEDGVRLHHVDHLPLQAHHGGVAVGLVTRGGHSFAFWNLLPRVGTSQHIGLSRQNEDSVDVGKDVGELEVHVRSDHLRSTIKNIFFEKKRNNSI